MGMSTHVVGVFKPLDATKRMKAVWDSCKEAGVEVPDEVLKFFNYEDPNDTGHTFDIGEGTDYCKKYSNDSQSGFEINVSKLPSDIAIIRFYNSW